MRKNCRKLFRYLKVKISAKFEPLFEIILKQNELIQLVIKNCEKNVHYYKIFDSFYQSSKMVQLLESWKDLGRLWETNISHSGIGSNSITPFNRIQRLEITVNQQLHVQIWSLGSSFTFVTVAIKWEIFYPNWIKEFLILNVWFSRTAMMQNKKIKIKSLLNQKQIIVLIIMLFSDQL